MTFLMVQRAVEGEGLDYRWRSLDDISPNLVQAVIASEDASFCAHYGFDIEGHREGPAGQPQRSAAATASAAARPSASRPPRTSSSGPAATGSARGWRPATPSLIETVWGKRRIMEVYLNVAEWAPGVYGAEAAARHWFDKSADDLTAREAARLAAILPTPRRYQAAGPRPLCPPPRLAHPGRHGHGPQRRSGQLRPRLSGR